ncbi:GNAT family N-acetyltransferase, partial [Staphylococcus epidermidis]|uniref:GNAT family N-acetyltransferase n=1 Tax=Staphylococcus epidermidis TaxID=1282 RepID=UPI000F89892F
DYWNIFGAFEDDELVATCTLKQMNYVGNHIIQYAKEQNIETLMIAIASNNISAKVFFSSIGFENLAFEKNASKIGNEYFDENWLIYSTTESSD